MEVNLAVRRIRTALFPYIRMVQMDLLAHGLPFEPRRMARGLITHFTWLRFTRPYIHWRMVPEFMEITEDQVITYQFVLCHLTCFEQLYHFDTPTCVLITLLCLL